MPPRARAARPSTPSARGFPVSCRSLSLGACALSFIALPVPATAASDAEVAELRQAIAQLRKDYEVRISDLERRLKAAEHKPPTTAATPPAPRHPKTGATAPAPAAAPLPDPVAPPAAADVAAAPATPPRATDSAFNPAISLILEGIAAGYSRDPETWRLPGFQAAGHAGLPPEGLSLGHTELVVSANVDGWFHGQATLAVHTEDDSTDVELEEAFIDTLSLPAGFGLRAGRFLAHVGYLNLHHPHAWDFVDAPLPNQAFLGGQWYDDGVRLSWIAPTALYLELGVEVLQGGQYPVAGDSNDFVGGAQNYYLKLGGDVGTSHSWQAGLSYLRSEPSGRESGHGHDHADEAGEHFAFTGDSNLTVVDVVWKWAPDGNPRERNAKLQVEYFYRDEDGRLDFGSAAGGALLPYDGRQQGFYVQGVYQFVPRWRAGLRYDRIWSDNALAVAENGSGESDDDLLVESGLLDAGRDPHRYSVMLDYSHSEYSRLRLQYTRDYTLPEADDQVFLQYVMSLGAHGAHAF